MNDSIYPAADARVPRACPCSFQPVLAAESPEYGQREVCRCNAELRGDISERVCRKERKEEHWQASGTHSKAPFLACLLLVLLSGPSFADAPSQDNKPYRIVVALNFSDDPTFTRFFKASVGREVRDQTANALGSLAEVQVREEVSPAEDSATFPQLAEPPDWDKLFRIAIDADGPAYRILWRQLDAAVQYAGPLRTRTTPDRQWLAKAICLAVQEDFAPVATVKPNGKNVRLSLGGADRAALAKWLPEGSVMQPYWVIRDRDGRLACTPIPHTLLRIDQPNSPDQAAVISNLADPWRRSARVVGFRAIKLPTQSGRFRLRLVNAQTGSPLLAARVAANSAGFETLADRDRLPYPDAEGYVVAPRPFDRLAYLQISQGKTSVYRMLLPITEDWCDVEYRLTVDPKSDEKNEWHRQLRYRMQDVQVLEGTLDEAIREVNALNRDKRYEDAFQRVKAALDQFRPLAKAAREGVEQLEAEAAKLELGQPPLLAWSREQLDQLDARERELGQLQDDLGATVENVDAQNRARVLVRLAAQAESAGDVDDAIAKYELALQEVPDQATVREHVEKLRESWRIKGPEHQQARDFVRKFAKTPVDALEPLVPQATDALATIQKAGDRLTAKLLLKATDDQYRELADLTEMLAARNSEADREQAKRLLALGESLDQLRTQAKQFIDGGTPE